MTTYGDTEANEPTLRLIARRVETIHNEERNLARLVGQAREGQASWASIGRALGVSRQGALKRYGTPPDAVALEQRAIGEAELLADPIRAHHKYLDSLGRDELLFRARYPETAAHEDREAGRGYPSSRSK